MGSTPTAAARPPTSRTWLPGVSTRHPSHGTRKRAQVRAPSDCDAWGIPLPAPLGVPVHGSHSTDPRPLFMPGL
jgi:hypothetical protein